MTTDMYQFDYENFDLTSSPSLSFDDEYISYGISPSSENDYILSSPQSSPVSYEGYDNQYQYENTGYETPVFGNELQGNGIVLTPVASGVELIPTRSYVGMDGYGMQQQQQNVYGYEAPKLENVEMSLQDMFEYEKQGVIPPVRKKRKREIDEDDVSFVALDRDVILNITYDELTSYVEKLREQRTLTSAEEEEVKKQLRSVRNREYASNARKKKKEFVNGLSSELEAEKREKKELYQKLEFAEMKIRHLERENYLMQQLLLQYEGQTQPVQQQAPPTNYMMQGSAFLFIFLFSFGFIFNFIEDPFDDGFKGIDQWHPRTVLSFFEEISALLQWKPYNHTAEKRYTMDDVIQEESSISSYCPNYKMAYASQTCPTQV